jgi:hypothetical protein
LTGGAAVIGSRVSPKKNLCLRLTAFLKFHLIKIDEDGGETATMSSRSRTSCIMASEAVRKSFCSSSVIARPPLTSVALLLTSMASQGEFFTGFAVDIGCEKVTSRRKTAGNFSTALGWLLKQSPHSIRETPDICRGAPFGRQHDLARRDLVFIGRPGWSYDTVRRLAGGQRRSDR